MRKRLTKNKCWIYAFLLQGKKGEKGNKKLKIQYNWSIIKKKLLNSLFSPNIVSNWVVVGKVFILMAICHQKLYRPHKCWQCRIYNKLCKNKIKQWKFLIICKILFWFIPFQLFFIKHASLHINLHHLCIWTWKRFSFLTWFYT